MFIIFGTCLPFESTEWKSRWTIWMQWADDRFIRFWFDSKFYFAYREPTTIQSGNSPIWSYSYIKWAQFSLKVGEKFPFNCIVWFSIRFAPFRHSWFIPASSNFCTTRPHGRTLDWHQFIYSINFLCAYNSLMFSARRLFEALVLLRKVENETLSLTNWSQSILLLVVLAFPPYWCWLKSSNVRVCSLSFCFHSSYFYILSAKLLKYTMLCHSSDSAASHSHPIVKYLEISAKSQTAMQLISAITLACLMNLLWVSRYIWLTRLWTSVDEKTLCRPPLAQLHIWDTNASLKLKSSLHHYSFYVERGTNAYLCSTPH